jgi:hypothetical protein
MRKALTNTQVGNTMEKAITNTSRYRYNAMRKKLANTTRMVTL